MALEDDLKRQRETLEATWWLMDREPEFDNVAENLGDYLQKMKDELNIYPFRDRQGDDRLFLARFEFRKYDTGFQYEDAIIAEDADTVALWVDFLAGFPIDDCEMLIGIGERSSKPEETPVKEGGGIVGPVPSRFFYWPDDERILLNLTALPIRYRSKIMAQNLEEPKPSHLHWWFRTNLLGGKQKFPVPGEFFALGVRMMPDKPWGRQQSSPFIYSGSFVDTVWYTGGIIKEVIDPIDPAPYNTYKVQWRSGEFTAKPSDFAEYRVDDRVTIFKKVDPDKQSQLWKDEDMTNWGEDWQIMPITFYGLEKEN